MSKKKRKKIFKQFVKKYGLNLAYQMTAEPITKEETNTNQEIPEKDIPIGEVEIMTKQAAPVSAYAAHGYGDDYSCYGGC